MIRWYENGNKHYEVTYKDGIEIGKHESWLDDGTKEWEYYYNDDGTRDSTKLITRWYESGQKWYEGYIKTLNDTTSVWIGLYTSWYAFQIYTNTPTNIMCSRHHRNGLFGHINSSL